MRGFREVGQVIRIQLRYLTDPQMRWRVTAATNKVEAYKGFSQWVRPRWPSALLTSTRLPPRSPDKA
ncbi:Tn3 family transposase [Streptomyces sp. f51]|uniref:Tn3 family transposase n=1 Tax=Streptomyces sp. f51 TaxID=1827742 RepID=UPI0030D51579